MSATCDCGIIPDEESFDGSGEWHFCPLHAEAEAMRDLLRDVVREMGKTEGDPFHEVILHEIADDARPILARIDGDTPDA